MAYKATHIRLTGKFPATRPVLNRETPHPLKFTKALVTVHRCRQGQDSVVRLRDTGSVASLGVARKIPVFSRRIRKVATVEPAENRVYSCSTLYGRKTVPYYVSHKHPTRRSNLRHFSPSRISTTDLPLLDRTRPTCCHTCPDKSQESEKGHFTPRRSQL